MYFSWLYLNISVLFADLLAKPVGRRSWPHRVQLHAQRVRGHSRSFRGGRHGHGACPSGARRRNNDSPPEVREGPQHWLLRHSEGRDACRGPQTARLRRRTGAHATARAARRQVARTRSRIELDWLLLLVNHYSIRTYSVLVFLVRAFETYSSWKTAECLKQLNCGCLWFE